jgi:hypothetical protein
MEELIFFALIGFASIIESVFRRRKARSGGGPVKEAPTRDRRFEREQGRPEESPTYDSVPSYDEWVTAEELPTYDSVPSYDERATATVPEASAKKPRVDTLGSDLLEVLLGGETWQDEKDRAKRKLKARNDEIRRLRMKVEESSRAGASAGESVSPPSVHQIHRTHAEFGTDPSERAPSEQDGLDPLARSLSAEAKAVRRQLRSDSASALRQAIVLQEVLGPPQSIREDTSA